jgi:hypothetical protein
MPFANPDAPCSCSQHEHQALYGQARRWVGGLKNEEGTKNDSVHCGRCSARWPSWLWSLVCLGSICVDAVMKKKPAKKPAAKRKPKPDHEEQERLRSKAIYREALFGELPTGAIQ